MISDKELLELEDLYRQKDAEKAKNDFYCYCQYREPDFYKPNRSHLKVLCDTLNDFYYNKLLKQDGTPAEKLMIRLPPQHGKSRTLVNFTQWCLGKNNNERIITGSYGDSAAGDFSRYTRDGISEEKNTPDQKVYSDVFPDTQIKQGNASYQKWALTGQHFNYLGVGVGGGVTGKGATLRIVDDLVKDAEVAFSSLQLEKIWTWFVGTFSSRNSAEKGVVKEIFCATLWSENDPQGILERTEAHEWYILKMEIYNRDTQEMLCDDFMSKPAYDKLKKRMLQSPITEMIFWANYHSEIIETGNLLYNEFKTYTTIPAISKKGNYTDTADTGEDYLCSVSYDLGIDGNAYVTDVTYTQEPMEKTEQSVSMMINRAGTREVNIESNNGGRGFARSVERIAREMGSYAIILWHHQSGNKESRIMVNSATVNDRIVFPADWKDRWPIFYKHVRFYKKIFKSNKYDDAPDCLTGIIEKEFTHQEIEVDWS